MTKIIQIAISTIICVSLAVSAFAQTAGLMPNANQQFFDNNGNPLSSGTVTTYVVGTTTLKTTWQDSGETIPNTNPIVLNAAGRAIIYGDGNYRQIVRDRSGNLIWDAVTSAFGTGSASLLGDGTAVGTILPWSGLVAPTRYVFSYGQELSRTTYSALYTAITLSTNVNCTSGSPILTGVADATQIPIGVGIEASCIAAGSTITARTASTITVSNNATVTLSTTAIIFPWGNGNGTTTFNLPDLRGRVLPGRDNMGGTAASRLTGAYYNPAGTPDALAAVGGGQSSTLATTNLPAYTPAGTIVSTQGSHTHFLANGDFVNPGSDLGASNILALQRGTGSDNSYFLGGSATAATLGITSSATPTITSTLTGTAQGGVATPFSIVQPSVTVNYIIKIIPDTNISTLNVVTSLGGMIGAITCGTGVTCSAQEISVAPGIGLGNVIGPASATDNAIARFDGGTGKIIQNSSALISDNGTLTLAPTAGLNQGFSISQTGTTGGSSAGPFYFNEISSFFNSTLTGVKNVAGLQVSVGTGGSTNATEIYGGSFGVTQTVTGVTGEQVGISGGVEILAGLSSNNNIYGGVTAATINTGASAPVVVGFEIGVNLVSAVPIRYGLNVDNYGTTVASGMDTAISIQGGATGGSWKNGITFTNPAGALAPALATASKMMSSEVALTVADIFSFSNVTATGYILDTPNTKLTGAGALTSATLALGGGALGPNSFAVAGTSTFYGNINYGGVTLSNAVTGTGNMVLDTTPTLVTPVLGTATGTRLALTRSFTSGAGLLTLAATQTSPNSSDTADSTFTMAYTLTAASATNELIARVFDYHFTNNLTGGGAITNARLINIATNTNAATTTTNLAHIYLEAGTTSGTVTTGYGLHIASVQGTTKWGILDTSGGNWANAGFIMTGTTVVASLASCAAGTKGARHFVTDSNAAMTAGIGAVVANGGANNVPVYCDGTNWRIG